MPYLPTNFGLLDEEDSRYDDARAVVLPLPFERTTSYGKGTVDGPAAIVRASQAMEVYDEELRSEPYRMGIATLPPFAPEAHDMAEALGEIRAEARRHLERGKLLVSLGGEHSLTSALVFAARDVLDRSGPGASADPERAGPVWGWSSSTPTPTCGRSSRARRGATPR